MARKFLYFITFCIVLLLLGAIGMAIWWKELTEFAFAPRGGFEEQAALSASAYDDPALWISRPGKGRADPARWRPANLEEEDVASPAAVFFVHPTSYIANDRWNAPIDDADARARAELFVRGMASPFNRSLEVWIPAYRQASVGVFLTERPEAERALALAYRDVRDAFDYFLETVDEGAPIVLAGHSQGSLHLMRLLQDRVAGTALADRIVAAYVVGWPVSTVNDLPAMGLPACATARQTGCVLSWQSFAEPADAAAPITAYEGFTGLNGKPNGGTPVLCSNPLTGGIGGAALASANLGTLVPNDAITDGALIAGAVPARCDADGILLIGDPPDMGSAVLPGNNYHVYDIPLFWRNVRADVTARTDAWLAANDTP